ncbi:MAG: hypothetical protein RIC24_02660 [Hyphomicrobiales bacterium]|jgi:hypothetical protein
MAHLPTFGDTSKTAQSAETHGNGADDDNSAEAVLALSSGSPSSSARESAAPLAGVKLLGAVSTLLALTPRGRSEELARLTALAHGYIGIASEDELVALAKAVASREDVNSGLADRLARASERAAHTLIRANRLGDETIAYLLEMGSEEIRTLIARHHTLQGKHITMLVANGSGPVLQALLDNRQTDFSADAQKLVERGVAEAAKPATAPVAVAPARPAYPMGNADPRRSAQDFANLDSAGRRAVMRRLAEDSPGTVSLQQAQKALDPTRNDADLAFLTVIALRDPAKLADLFAQTLELDRVLVGKLLDEADGDALLVLAKAAGLSSTAFARMLILGKTGLTGSPRDTFALVDRFNAMPEATARLIVGAMRGEIPKMAAASASPEPSARPQTRSIMSLADRTTMIEDRLRDAG